MIRITESGILFVHPKEDLLHIEDTAFYKKNSKKNLQMIEFFLLKHQPKRQLCLIEVKSSSPQDSKELKQWIEEEIKNKFLNALLLFFSTKLGKHKDLFEEWPSQFQTLDVAPLELLLILIIKGHDPQWLPPIQDALTKAYKGLAFTAGFSVLVLNEKLADKKGLLEAQARLEC